MKPKRRVTALLAEASLVGISGWLLLVFLGSDMNTRLMLAVVLLLMSIIGAGWMFRN